jgi:hypothetical protein
MSEEIFSRHFRMTRATFQKLSQLIKYDLPQPYDGFGSQVFPPTERLYMVLWYLATTETYRQLAARFGTTISVVHESVDMVLNAIAKNLKQEIQFPTQAECQGVAARFAKKNGFPGIVGALDGTRISIMKRKQESDSWIDRKGHHSIAVSIVVDSDRRILHYSLGCPGSFHDQRVYRLSGLEQLLDHLEDKFHIIADSAYKLSTHIIVPYKDSGNLTVTQKSFNYKHSCNRMVVEHTFGIIKTKFPRIHFPLQVQSWDRAVLVITCCLLLHNFIQHNDNEVSNKDNHQAAQPELPADKDMKRDTIAALLLNV